MGQQINVKRFGEEKLGGCSLGGARQRNWRLVKNTMVEIEERRKEKGPQNRWCQKQVLAYGLVLRCARDFIPRGV